MSASGPIASLWPCAGAPVYHDEPTSSDGPWRGLIGGVRKPRRPLASPQIRQIQNRHHGACHGRARTSEAPTRAHELQLLEKMDRRKNPKKIGDGTHARDRTRMN